MTGSIYYTSTQRKEIFNDQFYKDIKYEDRKVLFHFILDYVSHCIAKGKTVSLVANPKYFELLNDWMKSSSLQPYLITDQDQRFIIPANNTKSEVKKIEDHFTLHHAEYEKNYDKVESIYKSISTSVLGSKTFHDLTIYLAIHRSTNTISIIPNIAFDFNPKEYQLLKSFLTESNRVSENVVDFDPFSEPKHVATSTSIDEKDIENKISSFIQLRTEVTVLQKKFETAFHHQITTWEAANYQEYLLLQSDLDDFETMAMDYKLKNGYTEVIKPGIINFNAVQKDKYDQWKKLVEKAQLILSNIKSYSWIGPIEMQIVNLVDVEKMIETLQEKISNYKFLSQQMINSKLNRINFVNADDQVFKECYEQLTEIIHQFNELNNDKNNFEANTNSCLRHLDICKRLSSQIVASLKSLSVYPSIQNWKKIACQLNTEQWRLFKELSHYKPEHREKIMEDYYLDCLQKHYFNYSLTALPTLLSKLDKKRRSYYESSKELTKIIADRMVSDQLNMIQSKNSKLYKKLLKGDALDEQEQMTSRTIYPIYLSSKYQRESDVRIEVNDGSITVANGHSNLAQGPTSIISHFIDNIAPDIESPLSEFSSIVQLSKAKILSRYLLISSQNIRLFQLKSANVIAVVHNDVTDFLIDDLFDHGVKETDIAGREYEAIIESIIDTSRKQYLICEYGLLNLKNTEDFLWQQEIVSKMATAGFEILNIDAIELMKEGKNYLHQISSILLDGENKSFPKSTNNSLLKVSED